MGFRETISNFFTPKEEKKTDDSTVEENGDKPAEQCDPESGCTEEKPAEPVETEE